jgi:fluoride ion exporter CrcB/FEX
VQLAASVVLAGDQLHIQLDAGSAATGALLRAHGAGLAEALAAAGTPLATLAVNDPARDE